MSQQSPYDTGDRLEPHPWIEYGTPQSTPVDLSAPAQNVGKVDFDDDERVTRFTLHIERAEHGRYNLIVSSVADDHLDIYIEGQLLLCHDGRDNTGSCSLPPDGARAAVVTR